MSRAGRVVVAVGIAVVGLGAALGVAVLRGGLSARQEPGAVEAVVARTLRRWAVPARDRDLQSPLAPSPAAVAAGLAHFADHCAGCHGNDGSGRTPLGRGLSPRAPDLRAAPTQALSDGELFYVIENGIRFTGMPAFGPGNGPAGAEGSWQLVQFIRHLPALTETELAQMEALNPRSPEEWRALQQEDAFLRGGAPPAHEPGGGHEH